MNGTRRPITTDEQPGLDTLGRLLREYRTSAHLTRADLAQLVGVHPSTIERIERATRRTRRSTLEAIALALAEVIGQPTSAISSPLLTVGAPVLAPESEYADRIARRRQRRHRKAENTHHQRHREALWAAVYALDGLMDWALWSEHQAGTRAWLPEGFRLRGRVEAHRADVGFDSYTVRRVRTFSGQSVTSPSTKSAGYGRCTWSVDHLPTEGLE